MAIPLQSSMSRPHTLKCATHSLTAFSSPCATATSVTASLTAARHASLLRRPLRPYTFTQLLTLSDGSTIVQRTTSPLPHYKSAKDARNHPLWNPSSQKLANIEEDEAGRLRAFRQRFGRGWDAEAAATGGDDAETFQGDGQESGDLMDLISEGYNQGSKGGGAGAGEKPGKKGKKRSLL